MEAVERFLCLASREKGHDFLRQCAAAGVRVTLLTLDKNRDAAWPREVLEDLTTMPSGLNREQILNTVSWMARGRRFDRVVALDENDLETAAQIREHMRVPGMGTTTAGCYRDKLAQRVIASAFGYKVPQFCRVLNYDELRDYVARVPAPWVLRPRMSTLVAASRIIYDSEQLWRALEHLGDAQSHYILEQTLSGDLFYVDAIVSECEVKFSAVLQGGERPSPPEQMDEVFTTRTVDRVSRDARRLTAINHELAPSLGMVRGVTHAEFLRSRADGSYYFVEIGAGVGGAFLDQVVETATGVNLWREWAKLEIGDMRHTAYAAPDSFEGYAGSVVCDAQGPWPDLDSISDPSIVSRIRKDRHAGLIVSAASPERVQRLLDDYRVQFEGCLLTPEGLDRVPGD
jgi:biotin carboxylase